MTWNAEIVRQQDKGHLVFKSTASIPIPEPVAEVPQVASTDAWSAEGG
jgi:hypothetical protein